MQYLCTHRLHKTHKKWMRRERSRGKLRMSLCGDHIWVISKLYDLGKCAIRWCRWHDEACLLHLFSIERVEFESVTMTLRYSEDIRYQMSVIRIVSSYDDSTLITASWSLLPIDSRSKCPSSYDTVIASESHIPSLGRELFLVIHDVDDVMSSLWGELFTRSIFDTEDIPSEFYRHDLWAETDS